MVIALGELVTFLLPVTRGFVDERGAIVGVQSGDADLREVEVVGPVIKTLLGFRIRNQRAVLFLGGCREVIIQVRCAEADDGDVGGAAPQVHAVHVDVGQRAVEWIQRELRVELRAEQPLFLGGDSKEHDRTFGCGFNRLEGARNFKHAGRAAGVVHRTVVDRITVTRRIGHAEVIPVRGVDHKFVLEHRIAARDFGDDVFAVEGAHLLLERDRRGGLERHRREVAGRGLRLECGKVQAGGLEQVGRGLERDPAFDRRAAHVFVRRHEVESFAAHTLRDREGITRRFCLVNDQHAGGAHLGGLGKFVDPAAVVGHRLAAEYRRIEIARPAPRDGRIVDEHQDGLALDVHTLEVVPLEFRCLDAVADKHHFGVGE